MKDEEQHIDYDLLGKYLAGETSADENEKVEAWKASSPENVAEFERLSALWHEADALIGRTPAIVNTDEAWNKLQDRLFGQDIAPDKISKESPGDERPADKVVDQQIPGPPMGKTTQTRSLYYYAGRIAAVLVVGFLIYTIFFRGGGEPDLVEVVADNAVTETALPDNTKVTLNEQSTIVYPEKFKSGERTVELKGEAFFEVERDEKKPFVVRAHNALVRVLGTSFNVRAIQEETEISVTVDEGKVRLSDEDDVAFVILERNEKGVFNRNTGHIEKYEKPEGDEMMWRPRTVMFRDTRLSTVFDTLEKLYDTRIITQNEDILSCELTAKFQDISVQEILDKIAIIFNLTIEEKNNTFEISGDGC